MPISVKNWQDLPSTATPLSAAALEDLEARLGAYADSVAVSGTDPAAVPKSLYTAYGSLLTGSTTAATPVATALGNNGQVPEVNGLTSGGIQWKYGMKVFNAKDFGAVGDGTTNDSTALNNWLDTAAGNIAYLPAGTFLCNELLSPESNTYIMGAGIGVSIIKASSTYPNAALMLRATSGLHDIVLQGIEFDGNGTARLTGPTFNSPGGVAPYDANGHPETMAGMVGFQGTSGGANATRIVIRDCALHDSPGLGFSFQYVSEVTVINCRVWSNYRDGITLGNRVTKSAVIGCHVRDCGDDHIAISSGPALQSYDNVVVGNTIGPHGMTHSGHGIAFYAPQNTVCTGNTVRGGHARGIVVLGTQGGGTSTNNVSIANNTLTLPGGSNPTYGSGIELLATDGAVTDVSIHNNLIRTPLSHGIRVEGVSGSNCRWIDISNNLIVGSSTFGLSTGHGINLVAHANDIRMSNNLIREFYGRGIYHGPTGIARTEITGGRIENCCKTGGGPAVALGATNDVTITGLRVLDNQGTPTQTGAVEWGTSAQVFIDGCNFYLCSAGSTFTGTQPATANLGTYVDRSGTLQGGGGSGGGTDVASVEDFMVSHTEMATFPTTSNGSTTAYPIFVAPIDCAVTNLSIAIVAPDGGIAANNTNYYTVSPVRYRADSAGATIATKTTQVTGGTAIPDRRTEWDFQGATWSVPNSTLLKGDLLSVLWTATGTPTAITLGLVMTVKYEPA